MRSSYEYVVTVEVKAGSDKNEKDALKKFKQDLQAKYCSMDAAAMITRIVRNS